MRRGKKPVKINGNDNPKPTNKKTRKLSNTEEVKAKVSAVPRKGAEQGVERIVANTPLKKSALKPAFKALLVSVLPPGVTNSKSPNIFKLMTKRIMIMKKTKIGDCN